MAEDRSQRYQAPIEYVQVRSAYNSVRAIAAAAVLLLSLYVAVALQLRTAAALMLAAAIVLVDALFRRNQGSSAVPLLIVDISAIGFVLLARGMSPGAQATAILYVLTASLLLLSLPKAAPVIGYALAWATVVTASGGEGFIAEPTRTGAYQGAFDQIAVVLFISVIAVLLIEAIRALRDAAKRQELALASERRAVELKNEFVSMVSHELRTPLTSIAGFTETLREDWRDLSPPEMDEFLTIMRRETQLLSNLVEDILVIPRLEAGQLRLETVELDLAQESFDTAGMVFQEDEKECDVTIPGGVFVRADPVRLKQILRNLLENARKYGGDQVLVDGEPYGEAMYKVIITDNGPGVRESDRDRIFEHFEQVSKGDARLEQGVGLGLPIARKLARAMGGDLWYEPRFPVGARFCFTIRLARIPTPDGYTEVYDPEPSVAA